MPYIVLILLVQNLFAITPNETLKIEHGKMRVIYTLKNHHYFLKVLQKTNTKIKGQDIYKQLQKLDLKIKEKEHLSIDKSFECYDKQKNYAYGIITSQTAREDTTFPPLRAWTVNEKDFKLEKVVNPYTIRCHFKKGEEKDYPFPPE